MRRNARKDENRREEEQERNTEARRKARVDEERRVEERERDAELRRNARRDGNRREEEHGGNTNILTLFLLAQTHSKIKLQRVADSNGEVSTYPNILHDLLTNKNDPLDVNFRAKIRSYNSALCFASIGATIVDVSGHRPYVFKIQGQVYYRTSHIEPLDGTSPKFAQLYLIDSSEASEKG
ncbi:hypothetical protein J437_LFUL002398 [Ladona fulva]|uniref:Helitron helicase-like domain-containing protein n=1 Tax=Ladona fulva TaxID=123851 RepID=A0A8K0P1B5_LADFU|nr:hypothetical protein J437_LFUL002398 [Ladona fulva]